MVAAVNNNPVEESVPTLHTAGVDISEFSGIKISLDKLGSGSTGIVYRILGKGGKRFAYKTFARPDSPEMAHEIAVYQRLHELGAYQDPDLRLVRLVESNVQYQSLVGNIYELSNNKTLKDWLPSATLDEIVDVYGQIAKYHDILMKRYGVWDIDSIFDVFVDTSSGRPLASIFDVGLASFTNSEGLLINYFEKVGEKFKVPLGHSTLDNIILQIHDRVTEEESHKIGYRSASVCRGAVNFNIMASLCTALGVDNIYAPEFRDPEKRQIITGYNVISAMQSHHLDNIPIISEEIFVQQVSLRHPHFPVSSIAEVYKRINLFYKGLTNSLLAFPIREQPKYNVELTRVMSLITNPIKYFYFQQNGT